MEENVESNEPRGLFEGLPEIGSVTGQEGVMPASWANWLVGCWEKVRGKR